MAFYQMLKAVEECQNILPVSSPDQASCMPGYELQQFVMISPEVWQDLHWRYTHDYWPWFVMFFLLNALAMVERWQFLFFTYVAFSWCFLGVVFFMQYVDQVHTYATLMGIVSVCQGLVMFYLKVLRVKPVQQVALNWPRRCALMLFGVTALVPLSYVMENSEHSILLFGWGAEQTALGTVAVLIFSLQKKIELLLLPIPIILLVLYRLLL